MSLLRIMGLAATAEQVVIQEGHALQLNTTKKATLSSGTGTPRARRPRTPAGGGSVAATRAATPAGVDPQRRVSELPGAPAPAGERHGGSRKFC